MQGIYIETGDLKDHLKKITKGYWVKSKKVKTRSKFWRFSDSKYYLPTFDEAKEFVDKNPIKPADHFKESFDCDDYSFVLKGSMSLYVRDKVKVDNSMCLGIVWGYFNWANGYHSCNWVFDSKFKFHLIEPQTGELKEMADCTGNIDLMIV